MAKAARRKATQSNRGVKTLRTVTEIRDIRMASLTVAYWDGDTGNTYSLLGLSTEGEVFRYKPGKDAWVALGMREIPGTPNNRARARVPSDPDDREDWEGLDGGGY